MKLTVLTAAVVLFAGFEGPGILGYRMWKKTFEEPGSAAQEQSAAEREAASERWRRWRNYNRYPGPIPTPEEWEPPAGPICS